MAEIVMRSPGFCVCLRLHRARSPGCVNYLPHFVAGEPATVLIYEQYADEAALDFHRNSPHFQQYAAGALYSLKHTRMVEHLDTVD
jgi:quinol monooxygenase YgiN